MPSNTTPALEARELSKAFGSHEALKKLNLRVDEGEIYCLLGGNGAGKTTTINLFLNFLKPTSGSARVMGMDVSENPSLVRSRITYLPEQVALYPELTGLENLSYLLSLSESEKRPADELSAFLVESGLDQEHHRKVVSGYSKGMRQKVGVALALAKRSEALLLDEPTSGLDPASANDFSEILTKLATQGAAILMVTHDLFRVKQISQRVGIMKAGVLVEERETCELDAQDLETLYLQHMRN